MTRHSLFINALSIAMLLYSPCAIAISSALESKTTNAQHANTPKSLADVVEKVMPAVVNISVIQKTTKIKDDNYSDELQDLLREFLERRFGGVENNDTPEGVRRPNVLGSGFIIDPSGYIVTNNHVVDGAEEISVTMSDKQVVDYKAKLIGQDEKTDLALIKIESKEPLPYIKFGDVSNIRVGDSVFAVGNPFGLGGTVTQGIISAKARTVNINGLSDDIQTDAAINRGNSGGPLCNSNTGEVVGVNSAIITTNGGSLGISFAIPANVAQPVIEQLRKHGKVSRGWLGVKIQMVDENIAKSIGMEKPIGALVFEIMPNSPAAKAGIQVGDVIMKMNDVEILNMSKLPRIVAETPIGKSVAVEVFRNNKNVKLVAKIEKPSNNNPFDDEMSQDEISNDKNAPQNILGIKVQQISDATRIKYNISPSVTNGVVISAIEPKSKASSIGLHTGDVIMRINQTALNSVKDFEMALSDAKKGKKTFIMMLVARKQSKSFITLEMHDKTQEIDKNSK